MQFDVAVVGASVTGSSVAALACERGMSVALIDGRGRDDLGGWRGLCAVAVWALEQSRLPVGEVLAVPSRVHVLAGDAHRVFRAPDCLLVDAHALVHALVDRTCRSGGTLLDRTEVLGLDHDGVATAGGTVSARFVVDASGSAGARLLGERALAPRSVASVAREVHAVDDRVLADGFLASLGASDGEVIAFLAACGAGTTIVVRVDGDQVALDAATFGGEEHRPTARAAIRRFVRAMPWIGELASGEAREVALGSLRSAVTSGHVALVGDAAGATRPTAGGTLAAGILSARMLVDTIAEDGDLARYESCFRRAFTNVAAFDAALLEGLARLDAGELARTLRHGHVGESIVRGLFEQRVPRLLPLRVAGTVALAAGGSAIARAITPVHALPRLVLERSRG